MNNGEPESNVPDALPMGTQIGEDYTILRVLGQGSFGITYLAHDEIKGGEVVIKESMPCDFAARDHDTLRLIPRPKQEENCTWACECFLDEARLLHRLSHPNIVPVTRAFSALNTAYYVMPHVGATELGEAVRNNPEGRSEAYLTPLLRQLLEALDYLHGKELLHRDLKPSNILMTKGGVPIIIDFGAAHAMVSIRTRSILASPGYAPFEQMQSNGNVGPWTDLYALGATFYCLITGKTPPQSADRMAEKDPYEPLASRADLRQQYSRRFLAGIDKALALRPKNRWLTAEAWAAELPAPQPATPKTGKESEGENTRPVPPAPSPAPSLAPNKLWGGISAVLTLLVLVLAGYIFLTQQEPQTTIKETPPRQEPQTTTTETPRQEPQTTTTNTQQPPVVPNTPRPLFAESLREIKHDDRVNGIAFSPDGKFLATGSLDKTARITEIATGRTVQEFQHANAVNSVAFSPDGKFLATNSFGTARITEVATGNIIQEITHDRSGSICSIAFSPDGKLLATGGWNKTALITEIASGRTIREVKHNNWVHSVAFSPGGCFIATGSFDQTARITGIFTGRTKQEINLNSWIHSVAFSPDGNFLAIGSMNRTARITEVATGRTVQEIKHGDTVTGIAFSPDGQFLATGSGDNTARITEVATGSTIQEIKHGNKVRSVVFSPDGKFLATGCDDHTARIYELKETAE